MAKVKIQGHASGTGVFTVTAPNSNTDRTITLPDADVTLGTDATKLPLAGGTMTGALDLNHSINVSHNSGVAAIIANSAPSQLALRLDQTNASEPYGMVIDFSAVAKNNTTNYFILCEDSSAAKFKVFSSGQVQTPSVLFGTDTAAANALDDYEEGTWTPTIVNGGSIGTVTYALYTKVGDLVSFYLYVDSMSITNNSYGFEIGGLPHQISNSPNMYGGGQVGYTHNYNWGQHGATLHVNPGGNKIYFHKNTGTTATVLQNQVQGLTYMLLSGTYKST